jgi:hypothetical protein
MKVSEKTIKKGMIRDYNRVFGLFGILRNRNFKTLNKRGDDGLDLVVQGLGTQATRIKVGGYGRAPYIHRSTLIFCLILPFQAVFTNPLHPNLDLINLTGKGLPQWSAFDL